MLRQIDTICKEQGVYPHAFFSAHAHNYQRYTRIINFGGKDIDAVLLQAMGRSIGPPWQAGHRLAAAAAIAATMDRGCRPAD